MSRFVTRFFGAAMMAAAIFATLGSGPATAQTFDPSEKAAIDAQIRAYILENPEVLLEAMQVLEQRQQAEAAVADRELLSSLSSEILNDGYSHVAGNPNGDVTVVEFSDYRCGFCKRAHDGIKALLSADKNVRLVIKEFPILGPDSTFAARAAMAAKLQGDEVYMTYNDALMRFQGELNQRAVIGVAQNVGIDVERLQNDMERPEIAANIRQTYTLARQLEINGTPGFIVGDQIVRGFLTYDQLREVVENAREQG
ncbi:MAG: DsbA family protein [Pseudomonadota bacterium]